MGPDGMWTFEDELLDSAPVCNNPMCNPPDPSRAVTAPARKAATKTARQRPVRSTRQAVPELADIDTRS